MKVYGNKNSLVIIIGCFHGDEPQGEFLINEYLKVNPNTHLLFIPRLNSENTRVNKNGVDLNRNFPTKNWILTDKNEYYSGNTPASETETQELIKLIEEIKPKAILTLHAPYKIVNYDCESKECKNLAKSISDIIGYPISNDIGYPTPGSFGTWAGKERNIPTITLELDEEIPVELLKEPMFKIFDMLENYR